MTKVFSMNKYHDSSSPLRSYLSRYWEEIFFAFIYLLLILQTLFFVADARSILGNNRGLAAAFVAFESFVLTIGPYAGVPLLIVPLACLIIYHGRSVWARKYLDSIGIYFAARMFLQLVGLNLLVFDRESPRFALITQLLFFLPYSLLIWGWIYWRLDNFASDTNHRYFRLDCERDNPRPIDYLVASFSSVFSASINSIKGRSARARILTIVHGFVVYDIMGLTLSRAVALIQSK